MRIAIIGPPGAGKTTQASKLASKLKLIHLSTGQIFRSSSDPQIQEYLRRGELVPDELTIQIVRSILPKDNFVLDGFPRTPAQARALDLELVILIQIPELEMLRRLASRLECPNCAQVYSMKDNVTSCLSCGSQLMIRDEQVQRRIQIYFQGIQELTQELGSKLRIVDGLGSPDQVFSRILACLGLSES